MSSQELISTAGSVPDSPSENSSDQEEHAEEDSHASGYPPVDHVQNAQKLSPFWRDRLIEAGMIGSMACYYVIGNYNLGANRLFHLNPLLSLPFLLIFALLSWYRLPFAVALLPMALPYFYLQKPVYSHYQFSLVEIVLGVCAAVALVQVLVKQNGWPYRLSWRELRDRLGPFIVPTLIFVLAAAISVVIAYAHRDALRAFRQEVFDPLLFLLLACYCLRTRQDVARLLLALFGSAFVVALQGLAQYFLFRSQLVLEPDGVRRVHALFGSANNIGLFFDYSLPIGLALLFVSRRQVFGFLHAWGIRIVVAAALLPMLLVLYLSQSRGAWVAIALATLFLLLLLLRSRKAVLIAGLGLLVALVVGGIIFHRVILAFLEGHQSIVGVSTLTKRLYLWLSALRMIHDRPWFGFGLGNWLCYYSANAVCSIPALYHHHYWILTIPGTNTLTGLSDEPTLSHPHNIFLDVWVSMGIFGLLAFIALIFLFFRLFSRILNTMRAKQGAALDYLQWMTPGVGAAMLAGLIQGQVDNAFLAPDMAFCFWILVTALLLLRVLSGTSWRGRISPELAAPVPTEETHEATV